MRSVTPFEMFMTRNAQSLSKLREEGDERIDFSLFSELVGSAKEYIKKEISDEFELIPENRYFIGSVPEGDMGGFHSKFSVGYHNIFRAGFAVPLNEKIIINKPLRTIETVRNYLHDSLHHSTFCSFRRYIRFPMTGRDTKRTMPEIYREQYGINFRNSAGMSYSSPKLTHKVPAAINLNLLMDGVSVDLIASVLNHSKAMKLLNTVNQLEKSILSEIFLHINENKPGEWGSDFYFSVILSTRKFLAHWGGEPFRILICRAMLTGELKELTSYFDNVSGENGAWERVFRQPGFSLD